MRGKKRPKTVFGILGGRRRIERYGMYEYTHASRQGMCGVETGKEGSMLSPEPPVPVQIPAQISDLMADAGTR